MQQIKVPTMKLRVICYLDDFEVEDCNRIQISTTGDLLLFRCSPADVREAYLFRAFANGVWQSVEVLEVEVETENVVEVVTPDFGGGH